ncbi:saccharopine dehydrogenase NADP-binding domain-containing protein [Paeniglutamicibacter sp. NPDC012692]|uniref:saccharopine dehydrogenase NADP-binding domain-containing protein n=1 Tax=Paeniglutamicibacter sp. NPDC012692 TaxID=3364388 RepID=UPI0036B7328A
MILLIYGCGSMATRIAALACAAGFDVVLAGRPSARLVEAAERLNLPWRASGTVDPEDLDAMLSDVKIVCNTAGPFAHTAAGLMRACLRNGCHYLDLSNEATTFEDAWSLDSDARKVGVSLVPGAGFGTAAVEALAAHLIGRIKEPASLTIVRTNGGGARTVGVSRTMLEILALPGAGIKDGRWSAQDCRITGFNLPDGRLTGIPVALGDAFAVAQATGIRQVTAYSTTRMNLLSARLALPLVRTLAKTTRGGPHRSTREGRKTRGSDVDYTQIWIRATNAHGETKASYLRGRSGSELAARIALHAIQQLRNRTSSGSFTAGKLIGTSNILALPGLRITDI